MRVDECATARFGRVIVDGVHAEEKLRLERGSTFMTYERNALMSLGYPISSLLPYVAGNRSIKYVASYFLLPHQRSSKCCSVEDMGIGRPDNDRNSLARQLLFGTHTVLEFTSS